MFVNRSRWFEATHAVTKLGYEEFSKQLIEDVLVALKRDDLNDSQREYLIACLERTKDSWDANKGFYLKGGRGKKKKATGLRDLHATLLVIEAQNCGLKYDDALKKVASLINEIFPDEMIDAKSVERAVTKNKAAVLKDYEEIPALKRLFD